MQPILPRPVSHDEAKQPRTLERIAENLTKIRQQHTVWLLPVHDLGLQMRHACSQSNLNRFLDFPDSLNGSTVTKYHSSIFIII